MSWTWSILCGVTTLIVTAVRAQTLEPTTSECSWHWPEYPLTDYNLLDLATPTAFTVTFSIIINVECGTEPVVWDPTAFVNGTQYTLSAPSTQIVTPETDTVSFTFADLIVTSLIPGEVITMSWYAGAGGEIVVPTQAIPYIPASTTTPFATLSSPTPTASTDGPSPTSTTSTSSSSSKKAGIIAGSVVGALVVFGLAVLLGCNKYGKSRRRAREPSRASVYDADPYTSPDHWEMDKVTGAKIPKHKGSVGA